MGIIMKNGIPYGGGGGGGEQTEIPDWLLPAEYDSSVTRYALKNAQGDISYYAYRSGDYVSKNGSVYVCKSSGVLVDAAFSPSSWNVVDNIFNELSLKGASKDRTLVDGYESSLAGVVGSGIGSKASGQWAFAEGNGTASGVYSHAEGGGTASGAGAHAEGSGTIASGEYSHTEGIGSTASSQGSHAEGTNTTASDSTSHAEGANTTASAYTAHSEGFYTVASGYASHAEGQNSEATNQMCHSEGYKTIASGYQAHAENALSIASGTQSHAGGHNSQATKGQTFAHGAVVTASNPRATAFGISNKEVLSTDNANSYTIFSIGNGTIKTDEDESSRSYNWQIKDVPSNAFEVRSDGTVIEGNNTATGLHSHAEGSGTTASGENSHSEGAGNTASGWDAHAEGAWCLASGTCSHAEGNATHAEGENAHSGGYASSASASNAFSHGTGTVASNANQASFGAYNSQVSSTTSPSSYTMFSIGNGADGDHRSNAFEVRSDGAAYLNNNEKIVTNVKVPDAPAADGTYTLKCTVVSGVPTYSWVAD